MGLTKYEKETIIITSEGDDIYSVYTFNAGLKKDLAAFSKRCPDLCRLKKIDRKYGSVTYLVDKDSMEIELIEPEGANGT